MSDTLQAKFVAVCMDECRKELKQSELDMKAIAVSKLIYVRTWRRCHTVLTYLSSR